MLRFLRSVLLGGQALVTDFERVLSGMERIPRRVFMSSCLESWNHGYETIFRSLFAVRSRSCVCGTLAAADLVQRRCADQNPRASRWLRERATQTGYA